MSKPNTITPAHYSQAGPISGDMRQHLQALSELLCQLPDSAIAPARRSVAALFECLERVEALENAALPSVGGWGDFTGENPDAAFFALLEAARLGHGNA